MNAQVNELQVVEQNMIVSAFGKENGIQELFNRMADQARSIVPDVSTKKGRDAIASQAYKVSKSKTAVDNHGKELVAGIKAQAAVIDRDRKAWRDQCDALRDEIRKPLDEWEKAEEDRIQSIKDRISSFDVGRVDAFSTSELIQKIISEVAETAIDESFAEFANEASIKKDAALTSYKQSLEIALKRESEQAELERLRQEEILRQQKERDEAIARQAAEQARLEAELRAKDEAKGKEILQAINKGLVPHVSIKF